MSSDATIVSGRRVADRYRLVDKRSNGAWTAVDETLRRTVVVHLLPADADPEARDHFTAEARSLARLNHRNIVCTYDTGVDGDGTSYRVDELAGDAPLDLGAIADEHRVAYALQIIQAIADAHDAGLVHGELTSHSVLVDDAGRIQLRGLRLPPADQLEAAKQADVKALTDLIIALAPHTASPLRDVAVGWRRVPPSSARVMLEDVAAIPDDVLTTIPPRNKVAATSGEPRPQQPTPPPPKAQQRGRALFIGVVVALVIAAAVVAVVVPARNANRSFDGPVAQLRVTTKSFDPQGDKTERENEARFAVDGNPRTMWTTDRYRSAHFGNLKDGVGLILLADGANEFDSVTLSTPTRGWSVEVYVADAPATELKGWGRALATAKVEKASTTLPLGSVRGGAILIWITDPGPSRQVRIAEATVSGRAPQ
ncbi:MAG: eukaryotic-like serine/threonine-protein kinase [Actinomycetota bacterium]